MKIYRQLQVCLYMLISILFFANSLIAQSRCQPPKTVFSQTKIQYLLEKHTYSLQSRSLITIPVVVHVVWNKEEENISDEQILSQIEVLNQDFQAQNGEVGTVPSNFSDRLANVEFEFCLATTDPRGNTTNGIERVFTSISNIGSNEARLKYATRGGTDAWDTERYLNFWVAKRGDGILGQATNPDELPTEEQGLIIDYRAFGTLGIAAENAPYHLGRTATHELGHYFGLQHLWGSERSCSTDDGLEDTPPQSETYANECPNSPMLSCGNSDMYMNFLNYSDDACMAMFTEQQKALMWATLNEFRAGLLTSEGCNTSVAVEKTPIEQLMKIYPNPAYDKIWLEFPSDIRFPNTVFIYNSIGKLEQSLTLASNIACLNTQAFPTGVYTIVVPNKERQWTKRFIILK